MSRIVETKGNATLIELEGEAFYAKVFENNLDRNEDYHGPGGAATVQLMVDSEALKVMGQVKSKLSPKMISGNDTLPDGMYFNFKRKISHTIPAFGGLPSVVDAEGKPWDPNELIWNGAKVLLWASIYPTRMGNGTRLEGIKILQNGEKPEDWDDNAGGGFDLPF